MMRTLLFFIFLSASFTAQAGNNDLPSRYRGIWANPSCATPQEFIIHGTNFALHATPEKAQIERLLPVAQADDYIKVTQGADIFFLEITRDKKLQRTGLKLRNGIWPEKLDVLNPALAVTYFESCAAEKLPAWPTLHQGGLNAFVILNELRKACRAKDLTPECRSALFTAADSNGDDGLDYRELAQAWRHAAYLAATQRPACAFADLFPGTTATDGPAFAAHMMAIADADKNFQLNKTEISHAHPAAAWGQTLAPLRRLLPALSKLPDAQKECRP